MTIEELKQKGLAPEWMTSAGYKTVSNGYLLDGETPIDAYNRVASAAAKALNFKDKKIKKQYEDKFLDYMLKGWLCPASPVFSNMGTDRGLPISCFGIDVQDSLDDIYSCLHEQAMMTKGGGGVGTSMSRIRGRGEPIKGGKNGFSEGVIPWAKNFEIGIVATAQGGVRKGAGSINLDADHPDFHEFLRMRRPNGDTNRMCRQINHCAIVDDAFMESLCQGNEENQLKWMELMRTRLETGEPYIMFKDTVNRGNPECYKKHNLDVSMTNICTEITLATNHELSFVCCLSSLNLFKWDEWKDTDLPEVAVVFLNGVLNEFINKAKGLPGMAKAVRFAEKTRAIGVGVLGWHSLLQEKMIPFESFEAMTLNNQIFKFISEGANKQTRELAKVFGEPEYCKGTGVYNSHVMAVAPTRSNSIIAGDVSFGVEPFIANAYSDQTAQGIFIRKNRKLEAVLEALEKNDLKTWKSIVEHDGSVQHLDFLTETEKRVFRTAYEINQMAIVRQASQRQKYIDQSQSINLFFDPSIDPKVFSDIHIEAWKLKLKTLYYCRSDSVLKADSASREGKREIFQPSIEECSSCEG